MNYWDYDEDVRNNIEFLNTLDLHKFLINNYTIEDVKLDMERYYDKNSLPSWLEGHVLNFITDEEFADYIKERYHIPVWEHITHHYQLL